MKTAKWLSAVALVLTASMALAQAPAKGNSQNAAAPAGQAAAPAKKGPAPKTQAEYDAFKAAAALSDPEKVEAAANDFAQKFPDSDLRPFLFQQAMGMYQQANNQDKALEMARSVLKYDPNNAVALLTAAQLLAEHTHDNDLDKEDRLTEAYNDAHNALLHAGDLEQPQNMTPEQFASALEQLRGTAHEVMGTVYFKRLDYLTAIKEYSAAATEEKEHTDAVVYLRLAVSYDKSGNYESALKSAEKAMTLTQPGSQIYLLAEQEKTRLEKLATAPKPASK